MEIDSKNDNDNKLKIININNKYTPLAIEKLSTQVWHKQDKNTHTHSWAKKASTCDSVGMEPITFWSLDGASTELSAVSNTQNMFAKCSYVILGLGTVL